MDNKNFKQDLDTCFSERLSDHLIYYRHNNSTILTLLAELSVLRQSTPLNDPLISLLQQQNQLENQYCYSRGIKDALILWNFLDQEFLLG